MLPYLTPSDPFPHPSQALGADTDAPGLLCAGADLSAERLAAAYRQGIFPWFSEGQPVLWWSTDPRMVLHTAEFKLQPSLKKRIKQGLKDARLDIRIDHDTPAVIAHCAQSARRGQNGTWIVDDMHAAYTALARQGLVHSVETWLDGQLAGGLYCVAIGRAVYGESMFHLQTDASKIALAALVALCRAQGATRIDCQQQTSHLASLGARPIARSEFLAQLARDTAAEPMRWRFEPLYWSAMLRSGAKNPALSSTSP